MRKALLNISLVSLLIPTGIAYAQIGMMGGGYWQGSNQALQAQSDELKSILQSIYTSQNVTSQAEIDCSRVSDEQFEKLGDAYMSVMLPNEQQHQAMDNMMGGEGSDALRQAHITMGRSYLGCWSNYNSGPIYMPMMSNGYYPHGGYAYGGWGIGMMSPFGWITTLLIWTLLVLGIVAIIKWINKK